MSFENARRSLVQLVACLGLGATLGAGGALADDVAEGKRLALARCAPCHIVLPHQREEVALSPPFEDIARIFGFNAQMLAYSILAPHPRMNLRVSQSEAEDIAAYIASLSSP